MTFRSYEKIERIIAVGFAQATQKDYMFGVGSQNAEVAERRKNWRHSVKH